MERRKALLEAWKGCQDGLPEELQSMYSGQSLGIKGAPCPLWIELRVAGGVCFFGVVYVFGGLIEYVKRYIFFLLSNIYQVGYMSIEIYVVCIYMYVINHYYFLHLAIFN